MKFLTQGIVFSEIPDEITLELGISNCPFRCEGCHSPFLQKDVGIELTLDILKSDYFKMFFWCNLESAKKLEQSNFQVTPPQLLKKSPKEQIAKDQFKTGLFGGANQI